MRAFIFPLCLLAAYSPLLHAGEKPSESREHPSHAKSETEQTPQQMYDLAVQKLDGKEVPQDPPGAVKLLITSGDMGHVPSMVLLSACCMEGLGTPRNTDAAIQLMAMAANKGAPDAQRRLALFYNEGIGVPRDPKTALHWFQKAADQNDPLSLYFLGTFYSQGLEVKHSESKALEYFLKAAYLNEPRGQVITAGCYAKGFGTARDYSEAYAWALVAADNGFPETKNQLYPMMPQKVLDEARPRAKVLQKKISERMRASSKKA